MTQIWYENPCMIIKNRVLERVVIFDNSELYSYTSEIIMFQWTTFPIMLSLWNQHLPSRHMEWNSTTFGIVVLIVELIIIIITILIIMALRIIMNMNL